MGLFCLAGERVFLIVDLPDRCLIVSMRKPVQNSSTRAWARWFRLATQTDCLVNPEKRAAMVRARLRYQDTLDTEGVEKMSRSASPRTTEAGQVACFAVWAEGSPSVLWVPIRRRQRSARTSFASRRRSR